MLTEPLDTFKPREIEILELMAQGLSNQEIAEQLFLSKQTVRWYNKQIYSKLGTSRRIEAVELGRRMGLLGDPPSKESDTGAHHTLPATTGPFIGREEELVELAELMEKPDIRLLSLIAAGGMGKSRMALELGHHIQERFAHGAAFIDLTTVEKPEDVVQTALSSLGISPSSELSPLQALQNYCQEKALLLIFDNFEHVLPEAKLLANLLAEAPGIKIIATSRERLNLLAETAFTLHPVSESGHLLFIEYANMRRPNRRVEEDDDQHIARIVKLVGGLPLALVLAANWVDTLSVEEIAEEIESGLDILSAELGELPARQLSIQAVIEPTWKRLNGTERQAFMWAAVFRGGFTREAFRDVTGASLRTIQTLQGCSLLGRGNGRRFDMHPLIRQFAREKLEAAGSVTRALQAHLTFFLDFAREQNRRMFSGHYLDALDAIGAEEDNFYAALDWSLRESSTTDGIELVQELYEYWIVRSKALQAIEYTGRALDLRPSARLHANQGAFTHRVGRTDDALFHYNWALKLGEEEQDLKALAFTHRELGAILFYSESDGSDISNKGRTHVETALTISRRMQDSRELAKSYACLGLVLGHSNPEEALAANQNALDLFEAIGDLRGISVTAYNNSLVYSEHFGDMTRARAYCERSLQIKRQIGDRAGEARRLSVLAGWDIVEEELESAERLVTKSISISEELGERGRLAWGLQLYGTLQIVLNQLDAAEDTLRRLTQIAERFQLPIHFEVAFASLAQISFLRGDHPKAAAHIMTAIRGAAKSQRPDPFPLLSYAILLWDVGLQEAVIPILTFLDRQYATGFHSGPTFLQKRYFLEPLVYRVTQAVGQERWETAAQEETGHTLNDFYAEALARPVP